ncbi:MAG TPA: hypothetical protein VFI65_17870 [Streptosporangiaceae bacterium]|nr:hypothetical protein [Streptosporangiaceae bacterium]
MIIRNESGARWLPVRIGDFERWQAGLLEESARRVGAVLDRGGRVHRHGSVGSPVTFGGQRAWLRVSPFLAHGTNRNAWRGTAEAAAIPGVSKPALLHRIEWHADGPEPVPVSAEVLTLVTGQVASRERFLRVAPDLPPGWFRDLAASLAALREYPTERRFPVHDAEEYGYLLSATYRRPVPAGCVPVLGTEHLDLAWGNVTAPGFQILDMEHWGVAVTGYGAAYLYLTALEVPAVAARVQQALAGVLEAPSGRYAQLVAAALIIRNLTRLPDPGRLAARLHDYTDTLLT